jgi:pimeloyl-ACP methyl ester carboxylesterase
VVAAASMRVPRDLYPFEGKLLNLGGLRYHYLDEGKGEPVVMVHGNPSWSFYYRNLVQGLRGEYRTIVPDHIGCGLSDKPGDDRYPYTLRRRVADLTVLLESLALEQKITLVLHDWGGMIGMAYAAAYPERIGRIVLFNTAAFHLPAGKKVPFALTFMRDSKLGALMVRGFNGMSRGTSLIGCKRNPMPRALRDAYAAPYDSWENRIATLRFVQDIPIHPDDPSYDDVTLAEEGLPLFRNTPALICWGEKDFVFDREVLGVWRAIWPHAEVKAFPDCGHYVLEDAADDIVPRVRAFLHAHPLP